MVSSLSYCKFNFLGVTVTSEEHLSTSHFSFSSIFSFNLQDGTIICPLSVVNAGCYAFLANLFLNTRHLSDLLQTCFLCCCSYYNDTLISICIPIEKHLDYLEVYYFCQFLHALFLGRVSPGWVGIFRQRSLYKRVCFVCIVHRAIIRKRPELTAYSVPTVRRTDSPYGRTTSISAATPKVLLSFL